MLVFRFLSAEQPLIFYYILYHQSSLAVQLDAELHPHEVAHMLRFSKQSAAAAKRRASSSASDGANNEWVEQLKTASAQLSTGLLPATLLLTSQVCQEYHMCKVILIQFAQHSQNLFL